VVGPTEVLTTLAPVLSVLMAELWRLSRLRYSSHTVGKEPFFHVAVQFCIAHLIRDIKFLTTLPDESTRAYGEQLLDAVKAMFKVIHQHQTLAPEDFQTALEQAKAQIIHIAIEEAPSQLNEEGKEQKREAQNMANRFRKHGQAYFEFILQAVQADFQDAPPPSLLLGPP